MVTDLINKEALIILIKSKARVSGHDTWEGGYYYLSNAEEIAEAIIQANPVKKCSDCVNCGCKK